MAPLRETTPLTSPEIRHYESLSVREEGKSDGLDALVPKDEPSQTRITALEAPFQTRLPDHEVQDEATGWAMDAAAKAPLHISAIFLGPALLTLANQRAQSDCQEQDEFGQISCDEEARIYGLRPSSILAASSVVVALSSALLMPIMGAVIDYSPHRRTVGAATAGLLVLFNACPIMLSQRTWPVIWLTHTASDFLYTVHTVVLLAFMYNLTTDPKVLASYTSRFTITHFSAMCLYLLVVIDCSSFFQMDKIVTAQFAHVLSSTLGLVFLGYAWTQLFGNRPPLHQLPKGSSLLTMGMKRIHSTTKNVWKHYPSLKWFLITLLFSPDAGSGQLMAIMSTFETDFLRMSAAQIGAGNLITLTSTIPGGILSKWLCHRLDALRSFRLCLFLWMAIPVCTAWTVQGPEQIFPWFYFWRMLWGVSLGWLLPTQRVLFCTFAPHGQETEMMGLLLCFHSVLAWLPPFIFGILNEAGWNMRLGLVPANSVYLLALIFSFMIGSYHNAVLEARHPERSPNPEQLIERRRETELQV